MPLSIDSLKSNLTNPARAYLWEVHIPPLGGGADEKTLMFRAQSTQMPGRSVGDILVPFMQTAGVRFPGKLTYSHDWACTFLEGEDGVVFDALYNWAQLIVDDGDGTSVGDENLKTVSMDLLLLKTRGQEDVHRHIQLVGCYIKSVTDVALSYNDQNIVTYNATFSYDYWVDADTLL